MHCALSHERGDELEKQQLFNPAMLTIEQILDALTPELRSDPRVWPSLLLELVAVLTTRMIEIEKFGRTKAVEKAQDIVVLIAYHLGGRTVYLPGDEKLSRALTDIARFRSEDYDSHRERYLKSVPNKDQNDWPTVLLDLVDILVHFFKKPKRKRT